MARQEDNWEQGMTACQTAWDPPIMKPAAMGAAARTVCILLYLAPFCENPPIGPYQAELTTPDPDCYYTAPYGPFQSGLARNAAAVAELVDAPA